MRNHACTKSDLSCILTAASNIVLLDNDTNFYEPDIVADITDLNWAKQIADKYGNDFDVVIDAISHLPTHYWKIENYYEPVYSLLIENGIFFGYGVGPNGSAQAHKYIKNKEGLVLTKIIKQYKGPITDQVKLP